VRRFAQLTADEQQTAVQAELSQLAVDPAMLDDPAVRPALDRIALGRARNTYYRDPGDRVIDLPPPTP
jgi:hypothetical protein